MVHTVHTSADPFLSRWTRESCFLCLFATCQISEPNTEKEQ